MKKHASATLMSLSRHPAYAQLIVEAEAIMPLGEMARNTSVPHRSFAAGTLLNLAGNASHHPAIKKAGGIAPLVALAHNGTDDQKGNATAVLAQYEREPVDRAVIQTLSILVELRRFQMLPKVMGWMIKQKLHTPAHVVNAGRAQDFVRLLDLTKKKERALLDPEFDLDEFFVTRKKWLGPDPLQTPPGGADPTRILVAVAVGVVTVVGGCRATSRRR